MRLGPLNIELRKGGPGWKTTTVGLLKTANLITGVVLLFVNYDPTSGIVPEGLPQWAMVIGAVHLALGTVGAFLSQDKTYHDMNTASRAVLDGEDVSDAHTQDAVTVRRRVSASKRTRR